MTIVLGSNLIVAGGVARGAPTDVDYLVGTADDDLSNEIVVGATPGGELGGSWASPTVDGTHSGSAHHTKYTDSEAIAAVEGEATLALAGDVDVATGKILSSDGLLFPDTQVASADANMLDDYEEGDWTPVVGGDATYTTQIGRYVKIGSTVWVVCDLIINVLGTGSTTIISGLPFTSALTGVSGLAASFFSGIATSVTALMPAKSINNDEVNFSSTAAATATATSPTTMFANSARVIFSGIYTV